MLEKTTFDWSLIDAKNKIKQNYQYCCFFAETLNLLQSNKKVWTDKDVLRKTHAINN